MMTTERDELALDVLWGKQFPKGATEYIRLDANAAHAIAKTVRDAGYTKPRQVTTVEELDALPEYTLIRAVQENRHHGDVFEKYGTLRRPRWLALDPSDRNDGEDTIESGHVLKWFGSHSITVLYSPAPVGGEN